MNLSRTTWLILTIALSIIILASLTVIRSRQLEEQEQTNEELSIAKVRLNNIKLESLSDQQKTADEKLSQSRGQLEAVKGVLLKPADAIVIGDALFTLATNSEVQITDLNSSGLTGSSLAGVSCLVLPFRIKAEGTMSNLLKFTFDLNDFFVTGTIDSVQVLISENTTDEYSTADIVLRVYTLGGD